jgi:NAD(P)-dependent dehydrogenase (short-subunit alcohol dehydrogenase family)
MASKAALKGYARQGAYCASKHALLGMSRALALEMKSYGIKVHALCPGGVDTPMIRRMRPDIPQEHLIQPCDIADLVVYLARQSDRLTIEEPVISRFRGS